MTKFGIKILVILSLALVGCSQPPAVSKAEYRATSWKELAAFAYKPSVRPGKASATPAPIPPGIQGLSGQRLRLAGYMMPIELEGRDVLTFVLVRDQQACCYGKMPEMNEWVFVRVAKGTTPMQMDRPIEVDGSFEVGEDIQEGVVVSLYRMTADTITLSEGKPAGWKAN